MSLSPSDFTCRHFNTGNKATIIAISETKCYFKAIIKSTTSDRHVEYRFFKKEYMNDSLDMYRLYDNRPDLPVVEVEPVKNLNPEQLAYQCQVLRVVSQFAESERKTLLTTKFKECESLNEIITSPDYLYYASLAKKSLKAYNYLLSKALELRKSEFLAYSSRTRYLMQNSSNWLELNSHKVS